MRILNRLICTAVLGIAVAATASAQQGGGGGLGGGGQGGGGLGGGGGQGGGGTGGGGQGGGGQGSGSTPSNSNFNLTQIEQAPSITAPGTATSGGTGTGARDASNIFGPYYGDPRYQGTPTNAKANSGPGGFGSPLYTSSAAGRGTTGARGATGAAGGARGGAGANSANQFGTIIAAPVQISFPAVARFQVAPVSANQLQTDLSGMIARSTDIANPAGIQVIATGNNVTLRGAVRDGEEARALIGMVRLTPGVYGVRSELTFARP